MQHDYYSALAGIVMASARNNAQLRRTIYELARSKLRQQLQRDAKELAHSEKAQELLALETAIERIEADLAEGDRGKTYSEAKVLTTNTQPLMEIIPPGRGLPPLSDARHEFVVLQTSRPKPSTARSALMLVAAVILGGLAYVAIQRGLPEAPQSKLAFDGNISGDRNHSPSSSPVQNIPQPSAYGVYALTNGKLSELQPLPIRVPDQRIAISALVSSPSSTELPGGRAQFVVFRRDLVNNVPENVTVRVVAKVTAASTFGKKGASTAGNPPSSWAVRGISYEMKVAPIEGHAAMILIRPTDAGFSFSPGRYALVLKNVAYDFSVAGSISDPSQCVLRSDDSDAPVFTECPKP